MWRDYGFGAFKKKLPPGTPQEEREERSRVMLARALDMGSLVAVVGSGVSRNLGYPSWEEFAEGIIETTLRLLDRNSPKHRLYIDRLERFQSYLSEPSKTQKAERLTFFIGVCQEAFKTLPLDHREYSKYFVDTFGPDRSQPECGNPFDNLVKLPIRRFVTTNYDCEIERALVRRYNLPEMVFGCLGTEFRPTGDHPEPLSFTQETEYCNQLALFALADEESNRNMVFHCHGRWDRPDSLVASESDFQRWYISDTEDQGPTFRHTFDLLFRSNPLLFIGYSLEDEDLMQSLRWLGASWPEDKSEKSFFALLPDGGESDRDHFQFLYQRYGVHVVTYRRPLSGESWSRALCNAIRQIEADWFETRLSWIRKPYFRKANPTTRPPGICWYPRVVQQTILDATKTPRMIEHIRNIERELLDTNTKVLALSGDASRKKTWLSQEVVSRLESRSRFDGYFYWNAHYADDALNAIEKLLAYAGGSLARSKGSLLDRLRRLLEDRRYLLILDGGERLLRYNEISGHFQAISPILKTLLKMATRPDNRSTLLFVCQELPKDWSNRSVVASYVVQRLKADDLKKISPFHEFSSSRVAALNSVLDGHFYGLLVVSRFLERSRAEKESAAARLDRLLLEIAREPQGNRITTLIRMQLEALDDRTDGLTTPFLRRVGSFISPFSEPTLEICYELACRAGIRSCPPDVHRLTDLMVEEGLMMRVEVDHAPGVRYFLVHPTVRGFFFDRYEHSHQGVLPDFGLSGLTSGRKRVWPESKTKWSVESELFSELLLRSRQKLESDESKDAKELIRRAFSLIRSRMSAVASPNWSTYNKSFLRLLELLVCVKKASTDYWDHAGRDQLPSVEDPEGVLYPADLAWLYNEIGLCMQLEGYARDAWLIWEQGLEINRLIEGIPEKNYLGEYEIQSLLNMAQIAIDYCRFTLAEEKIRRAEITCSRIDSEDLEGQIFGYKGLLAFFYGDSKVSCDLLEQATARLQDAGNQRALCYFLGHWASHESYRGNRELASKLIKRAQAMASRGQHRDFALFLQVQELVSLKHETDDQPDTRKSLTALLREAGQGEMKKHEPLMYSKLSKVAFKQGDFEGARKTAVQAVAMANELGLKARQLRSLAHLAQAIHFSGEPGEKELGISYMKKTAQLARRRQYWSLAKLAQERLHQWGVFPDGDDMLQPDVPF